MFILPGGTELTPEILQKHIDKHKALQPRYERLGKMYKGDHEILHQTQKEAYKPDNRLVVNFAKYIVDTLNGYFIGIPVKVTHDHEPTAEYLDFLNKYNDQDDNNAELSKLCSIYGHAYEMLYIDEASQIGITYIEPSQCFMIYDDSIVRKPLYAVRYYTTEYPDGTKRMEGSFSDKHAIQYFHGDDKRIHYDDLKAHYFGDVPIIEYVENEERLGAFETVETLINAFDKAFSEKANDVDYYADAYLLILGALLDEDTKKDLRDNRIINMAGDNVGDLTVQFLEKPDADATQENLVTRLEKLIFHISMVANINDENFGSATGISLKYKLQSMNNLAKTKERKFSSGMNRRYRMIASVPTSKLSGDDWMGIEYQFTRNIPSNLLEESEIAGNLAGITSEETQLKVLSIVDNVKEELARKKEDQDALAYQTDYPTNRTGGELDAVIPKIEEAAEVQGKQLNGAQTQSLIAIMAQFTAGGLTEGQAINLIATAIGISKTEARAILNGDVQ